MNASKAERFAEFIRRLATASPATNHDEAFQLISDTLNAVEDTMTSIPYDPSKWAVDGRMYPFQTDSGHSVPGRPDVKRYRSRAHNTIIRDNGAIEIRSLDSAVILIKPGADGQGIEKPEGE